MPSEPLRDVFAIFNAEYGRGCISRGFTGHRLATAVSAEKSQTILSSVSPVRNPALWDLSVFLDTVILVLAIFCLILKALRYFCAVAR